MLLGKKAVASWCARVRLRGVASVLAQFDQISLRTGVNGKGRIQSAYLLMEARKYPSGEQLS